MGDRLRAKAGNIRTLQSTKHNRNQVSSGDPESYRPSSLEDDDNYCRSRECFGDLFLGHLLLAAGDNLGVRQILENAPQPATFYGVADVFTSSEFGVDHAHNLCSRVDDWSTRVAGLDRRRDLKTCD